MRKIALPVVISIPLAVLVVYFAFGKKTSQTSQTPHTPETMASDFESLVFPLDQKAPQVTTETKSNKNEELLYSGSWFDITYPRAFIARPQTPSDEAYFTSPDGAVEYYVFSPLWGGDPDYLRASSTEEVVSEKTEESGSELDKKIIRFVTLKARDGSYYRSFVSIKNQVDTGSDLHQVFGFKYKDYAAYERYRDAYVAFKNSLVQYAD